MTRRNVYKTNRFKREFKKLSHEAQARCLDVIEMLATVDNPRSIAYERLTTNEFVYRFGSYRILYDVLENGDIEILELLGVGHGHNVYR